jgi:hypothetical protein
MTNDELAAELAKAHARIATLEQALLSVESLRAEPAVETKPAQPATPNRAYIDALHKVIMSDLSVGKYFAHPIIPTLMDIYPATPALTGKTAHTTILDDIAEESDHMLKLHANDPT